MGQSESNNQKQDKSRTLSDSNNDILANHTNSKSIKKTHLLRQLESQLERKLLLQQLHQHMSTQKLKIKKKQGKSIDWYKNTNIFLFFEIQ